MRARSPLHPLARLFDALRSTAWLLSVLIVPAVFAAIVVVGALPAQARSLPAHPAPAHMAPAHSVLVSSSPADGASVVALPTTATLTFNEDINPDFAQVVVQGAAEPRTVTPTTAGPVVSAPLPRDLGPGRIVVRYRVVSKDGHPISGEIAFTLTGGATAGSTGTSNGTATSSGGAAGTASTGASSASVPSTRQDGTQARGAAQDNSGDIVPYVLTGTMAVLLTGFGLLLWRWERRSHGR